MRTRYLIIAMLVAVAIFVAKGFYVTQDVRQSTLASYQQFEFFSDRVHPLIDSYDEDVVDMIVRASHGLGDIKMLCPKLQAAQEQERVMLNNYILGLRGEETMDDKEMYIRAAEISIYIDQQPPQFFAVIELWKAAQRHRLAETVKGGQGHVFLVAGRTRQTLESIPRDLEQTGEIPFPQRLGSVGLAVFQLVDPGGDRVGLGCHNRATRHLDTEANGAIMTAPQIVRQSSAGTTRSGETVCGDGQS